MAELTTTITSFAPVGEHVVLTGSFTGEQDPSHIVLCPTTGTVLSCNIATPVEDVTTAQCKINYSSASTAASGSVAVSTASDTGTYHFTAHIAGAYF